MSLSRKNARGDTIIEVMLAMTIFAMLAVGVLTLMNRGISSAQDALETTLVRQQIDGQAEALRFLHQAYMLNSDAPGSASIFKNDVLSKSVNVPSEFGTDGSSGSCIDGIPTQGFALNPNNARVITTAVRAMGQPNPYVYSQITTGTAAAYGIWIEAVRGDKGTGAVAATPGFYDFHIRACWNAASTSVPRTLGTIVRLYVPAAA